MDDIIKTGSRETLISKYFLPKRIEKFFNFLNVCWYFIVIPAQFNLFTSISFSYDNNIQWIQFLTRKLLPEGLTVTLHAHVYSAYVHVLYLMSYILGHWVNSNYQTRLIVTTTTSRGKVSSSPWRLFSINCSIVLSDLIFFPMYGRYYFAGKCKC